MLLQSWFNRDRSKNDTTDITERSLTRPNSCHNPLTQAIVAEKLTPTSRVSLSSSNLTKRH
ncbi:hypothetical protein H6F77_12540 [Microcoleus sp. FACHB-831]|uniref:hypothetical protein n=1 Tax=Microcoleus sp. FACHB-831 TaxID=2692827 RepID=UPI001686EDDB|nr:hypothetical protein [Microcoleus sp. FACHB-831]MBD1921915.1 hypothetical protein [Microcoleus sp. FACHB-831]